MSKLTIKNRRSKMSPAGLITLTVAARKALKMEKGKGSRVTVAVSKKSIELKPAGATGGFRVSPKGLLSLRADARDLLNNSENRHYWVELDDSKSAVRLYPY